MRTYRTRPHGTNYAAWGRGHPLTPYYRSKPTDPEWLAVHPQPGRLGYRDWIGLVLGDADEAALDPGARRGGRAGRETARPEARSAAAPLHAAGYDMDNMKPRGFVESEMPVRLVAEDVRGEFEVVVRNLVLGAREAQGILASALRTRSGTARRRARRRCRAASPASASGTRPSGHSMTRWRPRRRPRGGRRGAIGGGPATTMPAATRERWRDQLRRSVFGIFDALVPLDQIEERDAETAGRARRPESAVGALRLRQGGQQAFYDALGLPPPESKRKGSKAA